MRTGVLIARSIGVRRTALILLGAVFWTAMVGVGFAQARSVSRDADVASPACTDTWAGGSGSWFDASNWIPIAPAGDHVPGEGDVACVESGSVTVDATGAGVGSLVVNGGAVDVSGTSSQSIGLGTYPSGAGGGVMIVEPGAAINVAAYGYVGTYESGVALEIVVILANHYTASFAGDSDYLESTDTVPAIEIGHAASGPAHGGRISAIRLHRLRPKRAERYELVMRRSGGGALRRIIALG